MEDLHELELLIRSRIPLILIESTEELRVCELLKKIFKRQQKSIFKWTVTENLSSLDGSLTLGAEDNNPSTVLRQIKEALEPAAYVLLDFHPYLEDPLNIRLIKEIAQAHQQKSNTLIFISHALELPKEINRYGSRFELRLPTEQQILEIVREVANEWEQNSGRRNVKANREALELLTRNLSGLPHDDVRTLARKAIYDDGAITQEDAQDIMRAKHELLAKGGILSFEYDIAQSSELGGLKQLKSWLEKRRAMFSKTANVWKLDKPKGILLLGVQGCGKSLAARVVSGAWGLPLLRLDFSALYNKFIGETERNLRQSLKSAQVMAPCVLWLDEIEKALSSEQHDGGTSKRVLGLLLTWMSEQKDSVFIVATANDISALPPELVRKGRFDEIFFVDLPDQESREDIFRIHLEKRNLKPEKFDIPVLAQKSDSFSGAEIEQAIVSALYSALSENKMLNNQHIESELKLSRPVSVVMAEQVEALRSWAKDRTVLAN